MNDVINDLQMSPKVVYTTVQSFNSLVITFIIFEKTRYRTIQKD